MNERVRVVPDEEKSIKYLHLNNMRLLECNPTDERKRLVEMTMVRYKHLLVGFQKQFEETR